VRAETATRESVPEGRSSQILTPDQRLRVFVSSTLQELGSERTAASEAIASLRLTPVLFELGARPHPPQALYRAYLQQSQLFVGLYWESYGWVAPGEAMSGIEDEFKLSEAMPRLLYVKVPAPKREPRLEEFLGQMRAEGSASYKHFGTAEELRELLASDLALVLTERFEATAEAVKPFPAPARDLPAPRTSFVGRVEELAHIEDVVAGGSRLVTLTGPGGIGKTRLAVEAARKLAAEFSDGVVFVPLDGVVGDELVPGAIAESLGAREVAGDAMASLVAHLSTRRMLLVLDNFEHVIGAAPIVGALLEGARQLTVLVTSRERLRLSGEHEVQIPPLSSDGEAVELFAERAASAHQGFELVPDELRVVEDICRRLEGVPLAIELAAPRMRLLTPAQLLERLSERLDLTGPRDAPVRQQTLEAAIAWSYDLLTPDEQRVFQRLGVFPGSLSIEAAEEVAGLDADVDLLDVLSSLLDKSIVYRLPHLGETRFGMLRMIREFALARLTASGELEPTLERLSDYYLRLAAQAEDGLRTTAQGQWRQTIDLEADNVRAVLTRAADRHAVGELSALTRGLFLWFWLHGNVDELREWVGLGLACSDGSDDLDRGWLLGLDGAFAVVGGDFEDGAKTLPEAEALLDNAGDRRGVATMKLVRTFGSAPLIGEKQAVAQLEDLLPEFDELGDLWAYGTALHAIGRLRVVFGDYEGAGDIFERAVEEVERVGDDFGLALASNNLARSRFAHGDVEGARLVMRRVLAHRRAKGIGFADDDHLEIVARVAHADGEHERASALVGAAERVRTQIGIPLWPPAQQQFDALLEELRAALGDDDFDAAWERGAAADTNEVEKLAVSVVGEAGPPRAD